MSDTIERFPTLSVPGSLRHEVPIHPQPSIYETTEAYVEGEGGADRLVTPEMVDDIIGNHERMTWDGQPFTSEEALVAYNEVYEREMAVMVDKGFTDFLDLVEKVGSHQLGQEYTDEILGEVATKVDEISADVSITHGTEGEGWARFRKKGKWHYFCAGVARSVCGNIDREGPKQNLVIIAEVGTRGIQNGPNECKVCCSILYPHLEPMDWTEEPADD